MYNSAHPAGLFIVLFMRFFFFLLYSLYAHLCIYLLISVTNLSMHLINIISIITVKTCSSTEGNRQINFYVRAIFCRPPAL